MDGGRFGEEARRGAVLARRCSSCSRLSLSTSRYCACGSASFEEVSVEGKGTISTYTIITVPPEGFEEHVPYAWAVMAVDGTDLRISGFMASIASPDQLPIGSRARVAGFDGRGLVLERD